VTDRCGCRVRGSCSFPGTILIVDPSASNLYASQRFKLWKDADSKFRSELDVRYTDAFLLIYVTTSTGSEVVLASVSAEARLDRPVDVSGVPLGVHSLGSLMLLLYTDTQQWVLFYEDNILTDSLSPDARWPVEPGKAIAPRHSQCAVHHHAGEQPLPLRATPRRGDGGPGIAVSRHGAVRIAAGASRSVRRQRRLAAPQGTLRSAREASDAPVDRQCRVDEGGE
jgi:hypothetical protein